MFFELLMELDEFECSWPDYMTLLAHYTSAWWKRFVYSHGLDNTLLRTKISVYFAPFWGYELLSCWYCSLLRMRITDSSNTALSFICMASHTNCLISSPGPTVGPLSCVKVGDVPHFSEGFWLVYALPRIKSSIFPYCEDNAATTLVG